MSARVVIYMWALKFALSATHSRLAQPITMQAFKLPLKLVRRNRLGCLVAKVSAWLPRPELGCQGQGLVAKSRGEIEEARVHKDRQLE